MERIDDLNFNGLKLIQDDEGFCFGCDAVELANFASLRRGDRAADFGAGSGIISVLLAAKQGARVTAVEIQPAAAELCRRNAALNGLDERIEVLNLPLQQLAVHKYNGLFDAVVCNPPYRKAGSGDMQAAGSVAVARHECKVTFAEICKTAAYVLKCGGKFWFIHQAERMAECLALCIENRLQPKLIQPLVPAAGRPPHLFMASCTREGKSGVRLLNERPVNTIV